MSSRTRLRLKGLGVLAYLLAALGFALVVERSTGLRLPGEDVYRIQAVLPSAQNLGEQADVRVGGVEVGSVERITVRGRTVVARLALKPELGPVHRDALVQLRYKTPAGEGYVDLQTGTPKAGALPQDGVLALSQADETVQLGQALSTFDPRTRRRLRDLLDGTGGGLARHGDELNGTLRSTAGLLGNGAPVFRQLARQRRETAALVDDLGQTMSALGSRAAAVRTLARSARSAAEGVAERDAQLRRMVAELPSTVVQADATATRLGSFSGRATPVVGELRRGLTELTPAIRRLRAASAATRRAVGELREFIPHARGLLGDARPFADAAAGLVPPLHETLRQVNPLVRYLARYDREIVAFFSNTGAGTESYDATGHVARLSLVFDRGSFNANLQPPAQAALDQLEGAGVLTPLTAKPQTNPLPDPGSIGSPQPFRGSYPRVEADP